MSAPNRPFADKDPSKKQGLKFTNEKSSVPLPKPNAVAILDEKAEKAYSKDQEYKQRGFELFTKFKCMIEDKILPDNKSVLTKDIENEIVSKLISLASEMNNDEDQVHEGIGSIVLSTLLMKMLLTQRDTINTMAYKIEKLEKAKQEGVPEQK
jgi:hypothetical protein